MSQGKIVQIIGAVVDVEFPRDMIPRVYDSIRRKRSDFGSPTALGDGVSPYHCDGQLGRFETRHDCEHHQIAPIAQCR